jgi:hypothetical protein
MGKHGYGYAVFVFALTAILFPRSAPDRSLVDQAEKLGVDHSAGRMTTFLWSRNGKRNIGRAPVFCWLNENRN